MKEMKNRLSDQTVWGCMLVLYNSHVFSCFSELLHSQGQTHVKSTHDANNTMQCNAMQCNFLRHYWWNARHLKRESIIWAQNSAGCVDFYIFSSFFFLLQRAFPSRLTLYNDLIAGNKDLLTIGCLCILEDGGALLGSTSGDCLQTLEAFRSWGCQLDCAISGDSN